MSMIILIACRRNVGPSKVFNLEHDQVYADKLRRLLELHGLADFLDLIDALLTTVASNG